MISGGSATIRLFVESFQQRYLIQSFRNLIINSRTYSTKSPESKSSVASTPTRDSKNDATNTVGANWKKGVVLQPVMTSPEDLKRTKKLVFDGFYIDHRLYIEKMPEKYTIEPFKTRRTGGRDLVTKERLFRRVGGGLPVTWYWVDYKRVGPKSGPPLVEKVIDIFKSRSQTSFIALVAHANTKRYILATQNMKVGDLIRTSGEIPKNPVKAYEGDAYPVGALPSGTIVHNIEREPGEGGIFCRQAGSSATVMRKVDNRCIVKLSTGLEISIDQYCMVSVGQVSNAGYKDIKFTHAVDNRDLGYRPSSGLWQRKTGRFGRKIRPPPPVKVIKPNEKPTSVKVPYKYTNWKLEK